MATGLNSSLNLSGSSVLPAYPGFIVIKIAQEGSRPILLPSKSIFEYDLPSLFLTSVWIYIIYWAITESTSTSIRLNSSKHAHAPQHARPAKNFAITITSHWSLQLNTMHYFATDLARSWMVSALPVPAGPYGAPPKFSCKAPIRVC